MTTPQKMNRRQEYDVYANRESQTPKGCRASTQAEPHARATDFGAGSTGQTPRLMRLRSSKVL
jgi:hypothetical protein